MFLLRFGGFRIAGVGRRHLRKMSTSLRHILPVAVLLPLAYPQSARAGLPECRNIRLEDAGNCELRGSADCSAGCEQLGIYKTACATELHTVCREECTLSAEVGCTDECTEQCSSQCDLGINVTCTHNCFVECEGACDAQCAEADEPDQCRASCEATCDGECDARCAPLVDGSCYEHCVECCGGSCQAQANMDCQTSCQEVEFETCEQEFRAECSASCEVEGALFCDGEYVLSGSDLVDCTRALIERGTLNVDAEVDGEVSLDLFGDNSNSNGTGGCSVPSSDSRGNGFVPFAGLLLLGLFRRCRR